MTKVLIVDDQPHILDALALLFELHDIETDSVSSPDNALRKVKEGKIGLVIQDMNFSRATTTGQEGIELFRAIRQIDEGMPVILMTAWASVSTAVDLVKEGADDYLEKPWDDGALLRKVQNLLAARKFTVASDRSPLGEGDLCGLVVESARMKALTRLACKVGGADVSVLVTGAQGTGKEKVAEILHANSRRRDRPFIKVDVGGLPDELFGAEIFGAEAGASSGGKVRRVGRFEAANGGTLFLDEIGNLSLDSQGKLLRALENGEFESLGSSATKKVDVRVVAATTVDLKEAMSLGTFREDLYCRLAVIELFVPPLTDRPEDILHLARFFIESNVREQDKASLPQMSADCVRKMQSHHWPGNVRELRNRINQALLLQEGAEIEANDMDFEDLRPGWPSGGRSPMDELRPLDHTSCDAAETETITRALEESNQVVSDAALRLGVSRQALYRRMQRLGIVVRRGPEE